MLASITPLCSPVLLMQLWLQGRGGSGAQIAKKLLKGAQSPVASARGVQGCVCTQSKVYLQQQGRCPEQTMQELLSLLFFPFP